MAEEKISAETTVMLTMQKLINAADDIFDRYEDKDDDTFMVITMTPDYIWWAFPRCCLMTTTEIPVKSVKRT